ncbi:MAG: ABC transporter permease, partial [Spirochaetaceae bacterium]|nr:ABC transporter permease [Spirochaetaceae bacterium]
MKTSWIFFIASRYIRGREGSSPARVLSVLGILTGVLALIVIIAVMNGFQLGFIESIVEVSSYHIRIEDMESGAASALAARARALPQVRTAVPFRELQALARGRREEPHIAVVRGLPQDALLEDGGMAGQLSFTQGGFDIDAPSAIILGAELALRLGVRSGDTISLVSINGAGLLDRLAAIAADDGGAGGGTEDAEAVFTVTGVFRTGYYEYDLGWA